MIRLLKLAPALLVLAGTAEPIRAGAHVGGFFGMSGRTLVVYLVDAATDSDGAVLDAAAEAGILTGELGLALDLRSSIGGLRLEGLYGAYTYRLVGIDNFLYTMLHGGAELYIRTGPYVAGAGVGTFTGYIDDEQQVEKVFGFAATVIDRAYSSWLMLGILHNDSIEVNARLRWHRMLFSTDQGEQTLNDYVLSLRTIFWF